jgi:hypothetical protein
MSLKTVKLIPKLGIKAQFIHRKAMSRKCMMRSFGAPGVKFNPPPVTLPVDCTGGAKVSCPMDGNDTYGDCGEAMAAHADNIMTFGQGKKGWTQSTFPLQALVSQYLKVSGGDNGLDETEVVDQIWKVGIAGNSKAVITDALDIDVTNVPLAQFAIANFWTIQMAWSVPDDFINGFAQGTVWSAPGIPDPNNGHYTPLADIMGPKDKAHGQNVNGFYRLWTWGTRCLVSPAFVASVDPQCFIVFSARPFNPATGLDSKGRHITTQAALWHACGGNPVPASVINAFPPAGKVRPAPKAVNWPALLAMVEKLLKEFGPLAVPFIDTLIATLPLTPAEKAALEALVAKVLGGSAAKRK